MPLRIKQFVSRVMPLMLIDAILVSISYLFALGLSKLILPQAVFATEAISRYWTYIPIFTLFAVVMNLVSGLYSSMWLYSSLSEWMKLFLVNLLQFSTLATVMYIRADALHPLTIILFGLFTFALMGLLRFGYRMLLRRVPNLTSGRFLNSRRTLLVGAGQAAGLIIRMMLDDPNRRGLPVVLVDDNPKKQGLRIHRVPVRGDRHDIPKLVKQYGIERIIIAIPSINTHDLKSLLEICMSTQCEVLKSDLTEVMNGSFQASGMVIPQETEEGLPKVSEETGRIPVVKLGSVTPEDLLGRDPVEIDNEQAKLHITGQTVLITGGGGSIGSELCRQLIPFKPKHLVIFDIYENTAYELYYELHHEYPDQDLEIVIGSVRDRRKVEETIAYYKPSVVFHAAAHKHVPLMEHDPEEAIKNNIFGTYNVADLSGQYGISRFTLVSTDKAVNPTNVMGASKRMCELTIIGLCERYPKTIFNAVRFGNVLGSHGSAFPLFRSQIAMGGPVTVTHPDIERYFMTIPEAARLVIEASTMAEGGEIYILDMGEPVNIDEMARKMIRLAGFQPEVDIPIEYIGLRPGEKMYEELAMDEEDLLPTSKKQIMKVKETGISAQELDRRLELLTAALERGDAYVETLQEVVPTYTPKRSAKGKRVFEAQGYVEASS